MDKMNKEKFKDLLARVEVLEEDFYVDPKIVDWLNKNKFFDAPASTQYHGTEPGDLCKHSIIVAETLVDYTEKLGLVWQRPRSPYVIGLFHDLCKIDKYYRKSEDAPWEYNNKTLLEGHGEKSVMLLSQFMTLTEEEILCIRYHMGAYYKEDWTGYDLAIRKYPNVLYTHTADMIAAKVYDV